jgi:uncharacterized protein YegL
MKGDVQMENSRIVDRPMREASEAHVALSLVLDVSASMQGDSIKSLNIAVNEMITKMKTDFRLRNIIDLAIFIFGNYDRRNQVNGNIYQGFRAIADCDFIDIEANDENTYVVPAINDAIEKLKIRTECYTKAGGAYKPWIVLITDGVFHDKPDELHDIGQYMRERQLDGKLNFFGLGVKGYKREQLEILTKKTNRIIELKAADFSKFFSWIGQSMAVVSSKAVDSPEELPMLNLN